MAVRAKVRCEGIVGSEVRFGTVYEPDETKDAENARFTKATPWGSIVLGIDNTAALEQFEAGKEYYVDFTPATSHTASDQAGGGTPEPAGEQAAAGDETQA